MHTPPMLEVRDVVKAYGGVRAIDGLTLAVQKGELHSVIGPNGAGKSTFFKLLMGTERPTEGTVLFGGVDITRLASFQRARLGITAKFQNVPIYQELTVGQNLFIPLRRHHKPAAIPTQTERLLSRLHLAGAADLQARSLSHGQQQWLAIGMALAAKPEVLLLDEPAAGMSPEETRDTGDIVKALHAEGATIVVIEHDMAFIRQLEGTVSVLHYGRLLAQGSMDAIERNEQVREIYLGTAGHH
ncbi:MAG: ABC transporter ATP-binding protein [Burkholderiales bacterium]|nr:ABC transporter ATP-binding protein [Burkholderiales bacterium]